MKSDADSHYRAVCRALVSEALEISSFIMKVSKHETDDELLKEIALQDWVGILQFFHELEAH